MLKEQYEKSRKVDPEINLSKRATSPRSHPEPGCRVNKYTGSLAKKLYSAVLLEIETNIRENLSISIITEFSQMLRFRMPVFSYL